MYRVECELCDKIWPVPPKESVHTNARIAFEHLSTVHLEEWAMFRLQYMDTWHPSIWTHFYSRYTRRRGTNR